MGTIAAEILSRVVTVEEWRKTGMNNNAGFETATNALLQEVTATSGTDLNDNYYGFVTGFTEAVSAIFKYDDADMRAFDAVADAYIAALKDIQSQLDDLPTGVAKPSLTTNSHTFRSYVSTDRTRQRRCSRKQRLGSARSWIV